MKKYIKEYFLLLACPFALVQFSCNKIIDLKPINELSDESFWENAGQFELAANEFYTYLRSFTHVLDDMPHADRRSDFIIIRDGGGDLFSSGRNTIPASDGNWNTAYSRLRDINYFLQKAETYAQPNEIAQYVAEARFFRAYVYFDLLQQFGGVPIYTRPLTTNSQELYAPRNTREETIDFIINDIEEAIPVLALESAIPAAKKGRISKGAAQAFLGRVTLYEGTWQKFRNNVTRANILLDKSITSSNAVITSSEYQLFAPAALGDSAQKYMFTLENQKSNPAGITKAANKEYILANRYDFNLRQIRMNITHAVLNNVFYMSRKLANMYLSQDGLPIEKSPLFQGYQTTTSEFENRDNRMRYNIMIDGQYYWSNENKGSRVNWTGDAVDRANSDGPHNAAKGNGYANQKWATERNLQDREEAYDFPVIRLAEVYLNYAEAVFERNNVITDADLDKSLNLVRNRVNKNMPKLSNGFVAAAGLDMREEIRRERNIEFYFEGFRIDDLKRWKTAEIEMPKDMLGIKWKGTAWESRWKLANGNPPYTINADGILVMENGRQWEQKHYLLPIPSQQIQLNPALEQNPDW